MSGGSCANETVTMADESFFAEDIVPSHHYLSTSLLSNKTVHRHDSLVKDDEGAGKLGGKIVWRRVRHRAPVPIIVVSLNLLVGLYNLKA